MPEKFDVAVVGAGPGGYVAAIRCAQYKKRTVCITDGPLGGVCLNSGCIPSKTLIHGANVYHGATARRGYAAFGLELDDAALDLTKLMRKKASVVKRLGRGVRQLLAANGVSVIEGRARLEGAGTLAIEGGDGADDAPDQIEADDIVLATGSHPIEIPTFAFDEERILSSTGALALKHLPSRLLVIGGGYIGLELGMCYAKLGSKVTIVEMMDQLLPGFDPTLLRPVMRRLKRLGVTVHTQAKAVEYTLLEGERETEDNESEMAVTLALEDGAESETTHATHILVTVGRRPNALGMGLETVNLTPGDDGFLSGDRACRIAPHLYAIGDVAGQPMLAHKASYEAGLAAAAIAGKEPNEALALEKRTIPSVIFTDPEIAMAGLTETEAVAAGIETAVGQFPYGGLGRALTCGERDGFIRVVTDADTGRIIGCQIVGAEASSLIAEAVLAIELGATTADLARVIHAHPTMPEGIFEAAEDASGHAVHTPPQA